MLVTDSWWIDPLLDIQCNAGFVSGGLWGIILDISDDWNYLYCRDVRFSVPFAHG